MIDLEEVRKVRVPQSLVDRTVEHLRGAGKRGVEGIALWVGQSNGFSFEVMDIILPTQSGLVTDNGLLVMVEADELYRINRWLYDHKMVAVAQIHSHPGEAYHSITDDTYPIVTATGGLSIVVPNFASQVFKLNDCAVYRLRSSGWIQLLKEQVELLIEVVS